MMHHRDSWLVFSVSVGGLVLLLLEGCAVTSYQAPVVTHQEKFDEATVQAGLEKMDEPTKSNALKEGLFRGAQEADVDRIRYFLDRGAAVNTQDRNGDTALSIAVKPGYESPKVVQLLVERGADKTIKNRWGETALDKAEKLGYREVANALGSTRWQSSTASRSGAQSNSSQSASGFALQQLSAQQQTEVEERTPLCAVGDATACGRIGSIFERNNDSQQALQAYLMSCSLWPGPGSGSPQTTAAEQACLSAGDLYRDKQDRKTAYGYGAFGCKSFHSSSQQRACRLKEDIEEELRDEAEQAERQAQEEREDAAFKKQMLGALLQGMASIGGTVVQGKQHLDAAKRGIILPPSTPQYLPGAAFSGGPTSSLPALGVGQTPGFGMSGASGGSGAGGACGSSCMDVECGAMKQACQQGGGQAACYRAVACVCRCHLNKGCSGSQAQMQQCVQDNEAKAQRLQSR